MSANDKDKLSLDVDCERQVPAVALQLFNVMTAETARAQDVVIDMERKRADRAEAEVKALSADLYAVRRVHEMLGNPKYARRLIALLEQPLPYEYDAE